MNTTDTPRTDDLIERMASDEGYPDVPEFHAMADLSRTLERELSAARQEIAKLELERGTVLATEKGLTPAGEQVARLEKEIAELRERVMPPPNYQKMSDEASAYCESKDQIEQASQALRTAVGTETLRSYVAELKDMALRACAEGEPTGWKTVPLQITLDMEWAARSVRITDWNADADGKPLHIAEVSAQDIWEAMWDAAPNCPAPSGTRDTKIDEIAALPDDWDSYGARAFTAETVQLAREVSALLDGSWQVVPCSDESIQFERHDHGLDQEIAVFAAAYGAGGKEPNMLHRSHFCACEDCLRDAARLTAEGEAVAWARAEGLTWKHYPHTTVLPHKAGENTVPLYTRPAPSGYVMVPRPMMEALREYWNGHENESAMKDALRVINDTLDKWLAAAPVAGEGKEG